VERLNLHVVFVGYFTTTKSVILTLSGYDLKYDVLKKLLIFKVNQVMTPTSR